MSVQSRRGRKVEAPKRNPVTIFYIAIGAVLIVGIAFLVTMMVRGNDVATEAPTAPVGQTAEGFYYKGNPEAPITVIAYEDYQCPACAFFNRNLKPILERDYINTGQVQFVYHEFPLDIHPNAVPAAAAARCAGDQGSFWQMHDTIFANQSVWANLSSTTNVFSGYAGQLGLDRTAFESCLASETHVAAITAAGGSSIEAGVGATPTFSVNGQLVDSGGLIPAIDAALRASGQ
ncbi:MAG: thioredoxin domain-containing protein [Oscillochloris sp.]|nr:thioredoxin domain-containing protein [Oscillochloris sp.]